jgi:hypothetical protein
MRELVPLDIAEAKDYRTQAFLLSLAKRWTSCFATGDDHHQCSSAESNTRSPTVCLDRPFSTQMVARSESCRLTTTQDIEPREEAQSSRTACLVGT